VLEVAKLKEELTPIIRGVN